MTVMVKNQESGFAINLANFENLINYCTSYGAAYNPSNPEIKLEALKAQLLSAKTAIAGLNAAIDKYNNATADRFLCFEPLPKLATRIINAVAACGVDEARINDIRPIIRKLRGDRATIKRTPNPINPETPAPRTISTSQQSFENKLLNFEKLIQLLSGIEQYQPNEEDLTINGLQDFLTELRAKNSAARLAITDLSNARILKNATQYDDTSGIMSTAKEVKMYVKSLFGTRSPQVDQINSLIFRK